MNFPFEGQKAVDTGKNLTSQAFTDDPELLAKNAKFVKHIVGKYNSPSIPLIIDKQALFESAVESSVASFTIGSSTGKKTSQLFSQFGITAGRPEILAVTDFEPAFLQNGIDLTDAGAMLEAQFKLRSIRAEKILKFKEELEASPVTAQLIANLTGATTANISEGLQKGVTLYKINAAITNVERALNLRDPKTSKAIKKRMKAIRSSKNVDFDVYTPQELMVDILGFNKQSVNETYMSTKIMLQILALYKVMLNDYSSNLFDKSFSETKPEGDASIHEILAPNYQNDFKLSLKSLGPDGQLPLAPYAKSQFDTIQALLPEDAEDRVTLCAHLLSRELRGSAGVQRGDVAPIIQAKAPTNSADIFNQVIGAIGPDVFTHTPATSDLAGLTKIIHTGIDGDILPFEQHRIVFNNDTYIPASTFFELAKEFDGTSFNTQPMSDFVNQYSTNTKLLSTIVERVLFLFDNKSGLNTTLSSAIMQTLLGNTAAALSPFSIADDNPWPEGDITLLAKAAAHDAEIKHLLFVVMMAQMFTAASKAQSGSPNQSVWSSVGIWDIQSQDEYSARQELITKFKQWALTNKGKDFSGEVDTNKARPWIFFEETAADLLKAGGKPTSFWSLKETIDSVFSAAQGLSEGNIFTQDGNMFTVFNKTNPVTLIYLIFEMFITLVDMFSFIHVEQGNSLQYMNVQYSRPLHFASVGYLFAIPVDGEGSSHEEAITQSIVEEYGGGLLLEGQAKLTLNKTLVQHGLNKLRQEEGLLRSIAAMLRAISDNLETARDDVLNKLDLTVAENAERLSFILDDQETQTSLSLLDPRQLMLITDEGEKFLTTLQSFEQSAFLMQPEYTKRHANALNAWLREPEALNPNTRVLTVGIPAGTLNGTLRQEIQPGAYDDSFAEGFLPRPIEVKVFLKNLEYPALIMKPKRFFFDANRFARLDKLGPEFDDTNITFEAVVKAMLQYVRAVESPLKKLAEGPGPSTNDIYEATTSQVDTQIVTNHVKHELIALYINLMSGLRMTENDYLSSSGALTTQYSDEALNTLLQVIEQHISDIAGEALTLEDLQATNPAVNSLLENLKTTNTIIAKTGAPISLKVPGLTSKQTISLTEGIVNFLDTFSADSFLNDGSALVQKLFTPKLFERIFHVFVNPFEFEIDVEKTISTKVGKDFLDTMTNTLVEEKNEQLFFKEGLIDISLFEMFTAVQNVRTI